MPYGTLGEYRRRRRRAAFRRLLQSIAFVAVIVGTATYAYQVGVSASEATALKLEGDLERFQKENLVLRDRASAAARRAGEADRGLRALRQRYDADIPKGELRVLLDEVERQLEAGADAERLALLIDLAGRPARCEGEPETKRFMPATPVAPDVVNAVRFGAGRIVVMGRGEPARDEGGLAEAWFDPTAPLELSFRTLGGESEDVIGALPLRHRMIVDGVEYRFSAVPGERAFVEITAQACRLPDLFPDTVPADARPDLRGGA